jgi:hypothetical protein
MLRIEAVLVVGSSRPLIQAVQQSVGKLRGADVVTCELRDVQTRAAQLRPFAMVIAEHLYAFDPLEFDALARDVRAELIVVTEGQLREVQKLGELDQQLTKAFSRRRS